MEPPLIIATFKPSRLSSRLKSGCQSAAEKMVTRLAEPTLGIFVHQIEIVHHTLVIPLSAAIEDRSQEHQAHHNLPFVEHGGQVCAVVYARTSANLNRCARRGVTTSRKARLQGRLAGKVGRQGTTGSCHPLYTTSSSRDFTPDRYQRSNILARIRMAAPDQERVR